MASSERRVRSTDPEREPHLQAAAARRKFQRGADVQDVTPKSGALRAGRRDSPTRFQTMDAALSWSTDLLPLPAVQLLCLLGAFRGGFHGARHPRLLIVTAFLSMADGFDESHATAA